MKKAGFFDSSSYQNFLLAFYVAVSLGIWGYFAHFGDYFSTLDTFLDGMSRSKSATEPIHEKTFTSKDAFVVNFIWTGEIEEFQAHQFYILDSYLRQYPNAQLNIYSLKLPSGYFGEFEQMGYSVKIFPITPSLLESLHRKCPFASEWMKMREQMRKKSPHYMSYLKDFLKGAISYTKGGICTEFDFLLTNPLPKPSQSFFDEAKLGICSFPEGSEIIKEAMTKNFASCSFSSPSQLALHLKQAIIQSQKPNSVISMEEHIYRNANAFTPSKDKHEILRIASLIRQRYTLLDISGKHQEEDLLVENNAFSSLLFQTQLFDRNEKSRCFIQVPTWGIRKVERKEISPFKWMIQMQNFGIIAGFSSIGAQDIQIEFIGKNCSIGYMSPGTQEKTHNYNYNPLMLQADNFRDLACKLQYIRVILDNEGKQDGIVLTVKLIVEGQEYSAAFPLYNVSREVTVVTWKTPNTSQEQFYQNFLTIGAAYNRIPFILGHWEGDLEWQNPLSIFPELGESIRVKQFSKQDSMAKALNSMVSQVETENFLILDPEFVFPKDSGAIEILLFQMNLFDVAGAELVEKHHLVNEGFGKFYKNAKSNSLKIKPVKFDGSLVTEQKFPQCFPVDYVPLFWLSKTFLFKELLEWDEKTFDASCLDDAGIQEDLFLRIKKLGLNVGTSPMVLFDAALPTSNESHAVSWEKFKKKHSVSQVNKMF